MPLGNMRESMSVTASSLLVQVVIPNRIPPSIRDPEDPCGMLYSRTNLVVPALGNALVRADLAIAVPEGTYARIAPRIRLAWRHHLQVGTRIVGLGYHGDLAGVLFNHSAEDFAICCADRVG